MKRAILSLALGAALGTSVQAAAVWSLSEGFNDISTLPSAGWVQTNNSAPIGSNGWFQGNAGVFPAAAGPVNSYIAANFNNAALGGMIDNWLMTPEVHIDDGTHLKFALRLLGEGFLDTVEVRLSTSGASSNVADFGTVLATYSSSVDTGWLNELIVLSGLGGATDGRVAFRYRAANTNTDADYIGIDSVSIPEPSTTALFGIALLGVVLHRRRKATAKG